MVISMIKLTDEERYTAVINCDKTYDGVFFYCVKTTGIYCKPSCKSKSPKRENTVFYHSGTACTEAGFRPCKRCRSDLLTFDPQRDMAVKLKSTIDDKFTHKINLDEIISNIGLSKSTGIEIFKKEYAITPKAYRDSLRINRAKELLSSSSYSIVDIGLLVGFNSLSAFYKFFKENTGYTPKGYRQQVKDNEFCSI